MKESLKSSSKTLYAVCICIVALMVVCYFGTGMTKGTYSASENLSCESGYKLLTASNGSSYCCPSKYNVVMKKLTWSNYYCTNDSSVLRTDFNGVESCAITQSCTDGTAACDNLKSGDSSSVKLFSCSGSVCTFYVKTDCAIAKTPTSDSSPAVSEVGCYIANNRYQWSTVDLGSPWKKVDIPKVNCSGCAAGYVENDDGDCIKKQISSITITFMNGSTKVKTESCTVPSGSQSCTNSIVAPGPQTSSDSNKVFNGWGEKDGCTSGSYTANAALRPTVSRVYYACYRDASGDGKPSADFSASKCTYSSLYTVTRDTRYLNCKYTNITYNNSATEDTVGNVSACCSAKGYMWVSENFTSSGYGNEYCLVCEGSSGGNTPSNPSTPSSSTPSSSTPSSSSNVDENPKTGSVAIFLVWIIALGTLVYAGVYFKQVRENN